MVCKITLIRYLWTSVCTLWAFLCCCSSPLNRKEYDSTVSVSVSNSFYESAHAEFILGQALPVREGLDSIYTICLKVSHKQDSTIIKIRDLIKKPHILTLAQHRQYKLPQSALSACVWQNSDNEQGILFLDKIAPSLLVRPAFLGGKDSTFWIDDNESVVISEIFFQAYLQSAN